MANKKPLEKEQKQNAPPKTSQEAKEGTISLEKQMQRHQSAPRPSAEERALQIAQQKYQSQRQPLQDFKIPVKKVIDRERLHEAQAILNEYKQGKANLETKIIENEEWYKIRHWECMRKNEQDEVEPTSAWLFNSLANKHADAMDNFPSPNILPREEGDKGEATMLTSIIPVILDQCEFEQTYSDVQHYKNKGGAGVYGAFWDATKLNGLGDITIQKIDLLNLYWEPGITDIQKSRNIFHLELVDSDILEQSYPDLKGKLKKSAIDVKKYRYDDTVKTDNKSVVVDWYYKKTVNGKTILHYCKYVNDEVLFATENETEPIKDELGNVIKPPMAETGWYEHGLYPFVFDVLYPIEGTPAGFGYIDIAKDAQAYIDRGNQAVMKNMLANAKPRYFGREDSVNFDEFRNVNNDIVHVAGNPNDALMPIQSSPLGSIYYEVLKGKIDELKETTGNRDISTGGTTSGVTAASAIAAMQEAGSKLSRDNNKASYRAFRKLCLMVIELIRQFYDLPRCFRILGENGTQRYVQYSNARIKPQHQGIDVGEDMGYRVPLFDIQISAQKQSPYSKMAQNEMALEFYRIGFFNPQMADQALACLEMMDFDRKDFIMQRISQNGTMYQQIIAMQQQMIALAKMVDQSRGSNIAEQLMAQFTGGAPVPPIDGVGGKAPDDSENVEQMEALGGKKGTKEASNTKEARQRVAESTSPT